MWYPGGSLNNVKEIHVKAGIALRRVFGIASAVALGVAIGGLISMIVIVFLVF
jgi:hypothetical protein